MIKVSVMYPNSEGATFDADYYVNTHMAMVKDLVGDACKKTEVDVGLSKDEAGIPCSYIAMGHLYFDSVADFQKAFGPHGKTFAADVPNYTNVQGQIQVSEVKV